MFLVSSCLALAVVACGGGDDDDARPQPTTTAPETTQSQEEQDEAALRQLAEDWYGFVEDVYLGREDVSVADAYIAEPYLSGFVEQVEQFAQDGHQIELSDRSSHEVRSVEVDGDQAVVVECVIDADVLLDANGSVLNDEIQANLYSTAAVKGPDGWRLSERETVVEEDGAAACAD